MDIKHIYEHISIDGPAEYQIKVKGDPQQLKKILDIYQTIRVTSESTDPDHKVCMITISNTNQQKLFVFVNMLLRYHYPIISVACSNVRTKKTDADSNNNNNNDSSSSVAISA